MSLHTYLIRENALNPINSDTKVYCDRVGVLAMISVYNGVDQVCKNHGIHYYFDTASENSFFFTVMPGGKRMLNSPSSVTDFLKSIYGETLVGINTYEDKGLLADMVPWAGVSTETDMSRHKTHLAALENKLKLYNKKINFKHFQTAYVGNLGIEQGPKQNDFDYQTQLVDKATQVLQHLFEREKAKQNSIVSTSINNEVNMNATREPQRKKQRKV